MSTFLLRYVGLEKLPARLSEFDRQLFFSLTTDDIAAIRGRFRAAHQVAAAVQLLVFRGCGRPMDRSSVVPRTLLMYTAKALGTASITIASLRSLYERRQTLYEHQLWAKEYLGLKDLDDKSASILESTLSVLASEAAHSNELITAAYRWLYERHFLIPGPRRLQDWARAAFASTELQILEEIKRAISPTELRRCRNSVYETCARGGVSHLDWLRTPSSRHAPSTIAELTEKIGYLKSLGVHAWSLTGITLAKQRAYAHEVQSRRPVKTRALKDNRQTIELVCFLRVSLLELTDIVIEQYQRKSQGLFRSAVQKVHSSRGRSESAFRQQASAARTVLRDDSKSLQVRCEEADQLLTSILDATQGSFLSRVRKALTQDHHRVRAHLNGLLAFEFGGRADDPGLTHWNAWRELRERDTTAMPADMALPKASKAWHELIHHEDREEGLKAFAACTMMVMRRSLRCGRLWVDHSLSFRERDQMLLAPEEWQRNREHYLSMLGMPGNVDEYLQPLLELAQSGVTALSQAYTVGDVEIGADGLLHLPALTARPDEKEPRQTRELIYQKIGKVQFPDLLLEIDAQTNFSESLLGRRATSENELLTVYAGLLAHGTDMDAKNVAAMVPGVTEVQVAGAMSALETSARLRRANQRVVDYQNRAPIAALWGDGDKGSADMMAIDASRHLWNARIDPRRRTHAVGSYTHVLDRWGVFYDQPIVLNERQAGVAINGVELHNRSQDRLRVSLLAVDTHGYSNAAMAVAKGLKFDLCPRLRDLSERKLYLPASFDVPEAIDRVTVKRVSIRAIRRGYDEYLRLLASIRTGKINADLALRFLSSAGKGDVMQRATEHLGRLLRTVFLCDYFTIESFRREIHTLLNRGESVHQLQRVIYDGKIRAERGRRREEMKAISGSHALLTNIVIAWNTHRMEQAIAQLRDHRVEINDDWLRRMGPAHFSHINFRGVLAFSVGRYRDALLAPRTASATRQSA
jgi:TnpA family transposase